MKKPPLPFNPLRRTMYSPEELYAGFDPARTQSYAATPDFEIYQYYVTSGKFAPDNYFTAMMEALHDNAITQSLNEYLRVNSTRSVAVMGGHELSRDSPWYEAVAQISRELARSGFCMLSGGGPGAMEATHLGAALARAVDDELKAAIAKLSSYPKLPDHLTDIVKADGTVDQSLVGAAHDWLTPAYELSRNIKPLGESVAIPTWLYGHEPTTPLSPRIAKYFQNSIREDGLTGLATHGVIYAEGKAGTLQEIFEDGAQNYYHTYGPFSPMIFLSANYWTNNIPVKAVLENLFKSDDFKNNVLFTDDPAEVIAFVKSHSSTQTPVERLRNYLYQQ